MTAVVGVEAWYEPFLFNFLYRDLFTAMIIGKELHVEACSNHHFVTHPEQCVTVASDNALSLFSSEQNSPRPYRVSPRMLEATRGVGR